ncbi:MAG: response regulator [Chloroherpetonaceae bacterium]|nr:response regulator [Chloroherpetonaceae bacterium]
MIFEDTFSLSNIGAKVLIVDDDVNSLRIVSEILKRHRCDVVTAVSIELAELEIEKSTFPIVICDWNLPHKSGIDFCKTLRANPNFLATYFIMITGQEGIASRTHAFNAGVDDYLEKPINMNELALRVWVGSRIYRLKEKQQEYERLKILTQTAVTFAHEINNPLSVISGYLELLANRLDIESIEGAELQKALRMIQNSRTQVGRIKDVVNRLVELKSIKTKEYSEDQKIIDLLQENS